MSYTKHIVNANSKNYGYSRAASQIKYLVYHYTANKTDTAKANANYFKNNVVKASAHYFVDENDIYQSVPDLKAAYAVGGRKYSDCTTTGGGKMYGKITNSNSISIEMCSTNGVITEATLKNAISLGKELMKKYNIPISNVYRHFDVNGKHCPGWTGWYGKNNSKWTNFKNRLTEKTSADGSSSSKKTKVTYTSHRITDDKWGKEITEASTEYSGEFGKSIDKITIKLSNGKITYTAHRTDGKWGGEITGYSKTDTNKYAGSSNKPIDAIAIKATGIVGALKYRVHRKKDKKWGNWITGYSKTDTNKYAGSFGKEIDAIQIKIEYPIRRLSELPEAAK